MKIEDIRQKYPQYADISDEQLLQGFHRKFYSDMPYEDFVAKVEPSKTEAPKPNTSTLGNIGFGALKGASDIGATLLRPVDWALNKTGISDLTNAQRRESLKEYFSEQADPDSIAFKGGELGAQVAGTSGAGGLIAKGLRAIPAVAKSTPALVKAIESGGFVLGRPGTTTAAGKAGDLALRTIGGAVTGGISAGLVDPESAGTGAVIGGAAPSVIKGAAAIGRGTKSLVGKGASGAIGATTGAGGEAVREAFKAGKEGNRAFLDNMRGKVDMTDVLQTAKQDLTQMRMTRAEQYRAGMAGVTKDKTVLDMSPITKAVQDLRATGSFKGQVINKNAAGTVDDLAQQVDNWASLDPAEFHTPEGLDALKQAVGDIRDATQFGTPARRAADSVYNAVKEQITKQAPEYAKVMKDYSEASDLITEIQKALSLGEKTSADTAMRKLQSLMRNNVNTSYGNRLDLAKALEAGGGKSILPQVAGQSLNSWMPRGMIGEIQKGGAGVGALLSPSSIPAMAAAAPLASPRAMGETAYLLGRMTGKTGETVAPIVTERLPQTIPGLLANPMTAAIGASAPALYLSQ